METTRMAAPDSEYQRNLSRCDPFLLFTYYFQPRVPK